MIDGNKMRRVEIYNSNMSGFDVGIGVNIATTELKVQGNSIAGNSYDVQTSYNKYTGTVDPVVDFGGGPLASTGQNTFGLASPYAYYHDTGTYPVSACYNAWLVSSSQVDPLRIYDKLDNSKWGRVTWDCAGGIGSSQSSLVAVPNENVNCRAGNSASLFDVVDFLVAGRQYSPIARGADNLWLLFEGPVTGTPCWAFTGNLTLLLDGSPADLGHLNSEALPVLSYPDLPNPTATGTSKPAREIDPSNATVPQCSDGIDNDGDGFTDMRDAQCRSSSDDSE